MHPLLFKIKRLYRKEKLPDPMAYLYKWFGVTPQGVLQIGANTGQEIKKFYSEGIRSGVFIEPLPAAYGQLEMACSMHANFLPINALCGAESGKEVTFHVSGNTGESSSMLKPTGHLEAHPEVAFGNELKLRTTTIDDIVKKLESEGRVGLTRELDLLYIDVQGAELEVLKGARQFLTKAKYVFVEVSHGGLYEGDVSIKDVLAFLDEAGFKLAFAYTNKHGWGDALFIKQGHFG